MKGGEGMDQEKGKNNPLAEVEARQEDLERLRVLADIQFRTVVKSIVVSDSFDNKNVDSF